MRLVLGGAAFAGRPLPELCRISRACGIEAVELWLGGAGLPQGDELAGWLRTCLDEGVAVAGAAGALDEEQRTVMWGADDLARRRVGLGIERLLHQLAELGARWCMLDAPVGRMLPPGEEAAAVARFARELARLADVARGLHVELVLCVPGIDGEDDGADELLAIARAVDPMEVGVALHPLTGLPVSGSGAVRVLPRLRPRPWPSPARLRGLLARTAPGREVVLEIPAGEALPEVVAARLAGMLQALADESSGPEGT